MVSFIQPNKWTKSAIIEEQESRTIYQNKKKKKTAELKQAHNIPNKPLYKIVQRRVQSPSKQFLTPLHVRIREYFWWVYEINFFKLYNRHELVQVAELKLWHHRSDHLKKKKWDNQLKWLSPIHKKKIINNNNNNNNKMKYAVDMNSLKNTEDLLILLKLKTFC